MPKQPKIGNQENVYPKIYDFHPNSTIVRAVLIHILSEGECSKCFEEDGNHYVDGVRVFKRIAL
jgi:hypothetical protein